MKYISTTSNIQDLQRWNPKQKKVILFDHNPNIFIQKSPLYEFYNVKLKEENQQRVGYFQLSLPLKSEMKANKDNVLRFKITMKVDKSFTITVSDFFSDFNNEFRTKNLKHIQDQILMTLAYIFGSNQAISELYLSEKAHMNQLL